MPSDPNKLALFYHKEVEPFMYKMFIGFFVLFFVFFFFEFFLLVNLFDIQITLDDILGLIILNTPVSFLVWYLGFRKQKKFSDEEVGIIIALTKLDNKVDDELLKLYKKIHLLLNTEDFETSQVKIRLVPDFLVPNKESQAHKLRSKFNAKLIVWGNVDRGNHLSEAQTVFVPIYFSYSLPHIPSEQAIKINQDFNRVLASRRWIINENNNILDREYVAQNLEEVALYIIGTVLFFAKKRKQSLEVLKRVLKKYETKVIQTFEDKIAITNLKTQLFYLFKAEILTLNFAPRSKTIEKDIQVAQELIVEMNDTGHKVTSLLLEGQVAFARGNLGLAISKVKEAQLLAPKDSASYFSLAFLYFFKGDLPNGWIWLKRSRSVTEKSKIMEQVPTISVWYEDTLKVYPEKYWIHFPLGIIYFEYLKEFKIAKESLEIFFKKYSKENNQTLRPLLVETERLLKKIRKRK